jgi:chromosome segregation ATPase
MDFSDFPEVKKAQENLQDAERKLSRLQSERSGLPSTIEDLEDELAEAEADAEVDGRDPEQDEDVQRLRSELKEKRARLDEIDDEINAADRVVAKLEPKVEEAKRSAAAKARQDATEKVGEALSDAVEAVSRLTEARDELSDTVREYEGMHNVERRVEGTLTQGPDVLPVSPRQVRQAFDSADLEELQATLERLEEETKVPA